MALFWIAGRRLLVLVGLFWLSACASTQGVTQFEAFRSAYEQAYATGNTILDQLAVAERDTYQRVHRQRQGQQQVPFNPKAAAYYTDAVDPPGTAAFRRSLATVKAYNDIVYGLATGQTGKTLTAQAYTLKAQSLAAATDAAAAAAIIAPGVSTASLIGLSSTLDMLRPFVEIGATSLSRAAFRDYLVQNAPTVRAVLVKLKESTPAIFPLLTTKSRAEGLMQDSYGDGSLSKMGSYRRLLSDWVILIDASIATLDQTTAALTARASLADSVAALTLTATDIQTAAKLARQHAAETAVH